MNHKQRLVSLVTAALFMACNLAVAEWLVTPEEAIASASQFKKFPGMSSKSMPVLGAPEINLITPSLASTVKSPVDIQLYFHPKEGAAIEPASFRVLYGCFGVDITSRILKYGVPTEEGIKVNHANLPKGDHRLVIQVSDKRQRKGETEIAFKVE